MKYFLILFGLLIGFICCADDKAFYIASDLEQWNKPHLLFFDSDHEECEKELAKYTTSGNPVELSLTNYLHQVTSNRWGLAWFAAPEQLDMKTFTQQKVNDLEDKMANKDLTVMGYTNATDKAFSNLIVELKLVEVKGK